MKRISFYSLFDPKANKFHISSHKSVQEYPVPKRGTADQASRYLDSVIP